MEESLTERRKDEEGVFFRFLGGRRRGMIDFVSCRCLAGGDLVL